MKIVFKPEIMLELETIATQAGGLEFSGFGYIEAKDDDLYVYDFELMHIGSSGSTEIGAKDLIDLQDRPDAKNMKLWVHRHPLGSGIPGPSCWSGTDNKTIKEEPLGGIPALVKWSCSVVRTPLGWVGRIDNHVTNYIEHVEVEPQAKIFALVESMLPRPKASKKDGLAQKLGQRLLDLVEVDDDVWDDMFLPIFEPLGARQLPLLPEIGSASTWGDDWMDHHYPDWQDLPPIREEKTTHALTDAEWEKIQFTEGLPDPEEEVQFVDGLPVVEE